MATTQYRAATLNLCNIQTPVLSILDPETEEGDGGERDESQQDQQASGRATMEIVPDQLVEIYEEGQKEGEEEDEENMLDEADNNGFFDFGARERLISSH